MNKKKLMVIGVTLVCVVVILIIVFSGKGARIVDYSKYVKLNESTIILDVPSGSIMFEVEKENNELQYKILDSNNDEVEADLVSEDGKFFIKHTDVEDETYTLEITNGNLADENLSTIKNVYYSSKKDKNEKDTSKSYIISKSNVRNNITLYEDEFEKDRYYFKDDSVNTNNYISFNNEMWRIISIEADGTIKIKKNSEIFTSPYDKKKNVIFKSYERYEKEINSFCDNSSGCNAFVAFSDENISESIYGVEKGLIAAENSELMLVLNEQYYLNKLPYCEYYIEESQTTTRSYLESEDTCKNSMYLYNNQFLVADTESNTYFDYYDKEDLVKVEGIFGYTGISDEARKYVTTTTFNIGAVPNLATIEEGVKLEKELKWTGYVGLVSATEFMRASNSEKCTHFDVQGEIVKNRSVCSSSNYMHVSKKPLSTITPLKGSTFGIWGQSDSYFYTISANNQKAIFPVLSLRNDLVFTGSGKELDPYIIVK